MNADERGYCHEVVEKIEKDQVITLSKIRVPPRQSAVPVVRQTGNVARQAIKSSTRVTRMNAIDFSLAMLSRNGRNPRVAALAAAGLLVAATAACGDSAERADQPVDTAVVVSQQLLDSLHDSLRIRPVDLPRALEDSLLRGALRVVLRADSAAGDSLYHGAGQCMTCHGDRGEGIAGLGPDLRDDVWLHGDGSIAFIQRIILSGAVPRQTPTVMPAFAARLSAVEAFRIAGYVYSLSHPDAVVDDTTGLRDTTTRAGAIVP